MGRNSLPRVAEDFLAHLTVERGLSKHTLLSYRHDLSSFFAEHETLDEANYLQYLGKMKSQGAAQTSVARRISTLRSFSKYVRRNSPNSFLVPAAGMGRKRKLPQALSLSSINALLESCSEDIAGIRDRALLEILYSTGMRVSECVQLDSTDLRIEEELQSVSFIRVVGKGSKERLVPLGSFAINSIQRYLVRARPALVKSTRESALFINQRGERLTRQGIWSIIAKAAARAGIEERVTPHSLRHSFATHLIERGADVRSVQEMLGHANVTTTQIYTEVTAETLREVFVQNHPRAR